MKHAGQNLALAFYVNPLLLTVVLVPWLVAIPVAFYLHKLDIREENEVRYCVRKTASAFRN